MPTSEFEFTEYDLQSTSGLLEQLKDKAIVNPSEKRHFEKRTRGFDGDFETF